MTKANMAKAAGIAAAVLGTSIYLFRRYKASCAAREESSGLHAGDPVSGIRRVLSRAKATAAQG